MHATFLIGPAGSGKTHRCLAEARAALKSSTEGPPLLFLAPKQATFQLERELLSDPELHGYTRLQILSFDRLARFVLSAGPSARLLSEQGRVMVLRSLLARNHGQLSVFHGSARLPGFARQLGDCLAELQTRQVSPARLREAATALHENSALASKLRDLALMYEEYLGWLEREQLHDATSLLELAAQSVSDAVRRKEFRVEALWLDGFAEFTSQEMGLLLAILPACGRATLAFCADALDATERDWLSPWCVAGPAAANCFQAVTGLAGCKAAVELLDRKNPNGRFAASPPLAHLEAAWDLPREFAASAEETARAMRLVKCPDPEAEATVAAHEILRHVRNGGRYREVGVILRNLAGYHDALRRVFRRYDIPFFIDRREPVGHHPLPELTRSVLRLAAFDWQLDDWLSVLKTGLAIEKESDVDELESHALEHGWSGQSWQEPFADPKLESAERIRAAVVGPFVDFLATLRGNPEGINGPELAGAFQRLWAKLDVLPRLETWSRDAEDSENSAAIHETVWEQMLEWTDDLALAFAAQRLPLREWIAIVDAGLSGFTVGVVPPALDQVLIGTVDRSRNPNLELALVMGLNETIFPAPPAEPILLSESDRAALEDQDLIRGIARRGRIGHERYYGYIAMTRARQRLVLSFSEFDVMDRKLNPSLFVSHVQRLFPALQIEEWKASSAWADAEHVSDLTEALLRSVEPIELPESALLDATQDRIKSLQSLSPSDVLSEAGAETLYGRDLTTSITSLERFGECPFKFFVHSGLKAEERKLFRVDTRKLGDFQHRVLKAFHDELTTEGKRWRDLAPAEARQRIARIAEEHGSSYCHGLFAASGRQRFAMSQLSLALQDFIEVIIAWMGQYRFDPKFLELRFGCPGSLPPWRLALSHGRALDLTGSIDRVDLLDRGDGTALCVVIDFKSSRRKIEPILLHNGIQMQLPAYLSVLRRLPDPMQQFSVKQLIPAGLFYVSLRGIYDRGTHRGEVLADPQHARRLAYRHAGRFDLAQLPFLDARERLPGAGHTGDQFNYIITLKGKPHGNCADPMETAEFLAVLEAVESRIKEFGERIFQGDVSVAPYRKGQDKPCDRCEYRPICRIDPWSHQYRALERPPE